jgi:hypothetical protein
MPYAFIDYPSDRGRIFASDRAERGLFASRCAAANERARGCANHGSRAQADHRASGRTDHGPRGRANRCRRCKTDDRSGCRTDHRASSRSDNRRRRTRPGDQAGSGGPTRDFLLVDKRR